MKLFLSANIHLCFIEVVIFSKSFFCAKVAFYIFTNGRQTLGLNLTERFSITDNALENMPWPDMDVYDATKMFKSKVYRVVILNLLSLTLYCIFFTAKVSDQVRFQK